MWRLAPRRGCADMSGITDPCRGADDQAGCNVITRTAARVGLGRDPVAPADWERIIIERRCRHAIILDEPHIGFGPRHVPDGAIHGKPEIDSHSSPRAPNALQSVDSISRGVSPAAIAAAANSSATS